jgi:hypothetical protein
MYRMARSNAFILSPRYENNSVAQKNKHAHISNNDVAYTQSASQILKKKQISHDLNFY